jgi:hypothetical protein
MRIELNYGGIVVELTEDGGGSITSDLHEDQAGAEEQMTDGYNRYEGGIDALESLILAHAISGVDIEAPSYVEGIQTAVEALANNT